MPKLTYTSPVVAKFEVLSQIPPRVFMLREAQAALILTHLDADGIDSCDREFTLALFDDCSLYRAAPLGTPAVQNTDKLYDLLVDLALAAL